MNPTPHGPPIDPLIQASKAPLHGDPEAVALIKLSMEHYGAVKSMRCHYRTEVNLHVLPGSMLPSGASMPRHLREFIYVAPNQFRIKAENGRHSAIAICDGTRYVEFGDQKGLGRHENQAPRGVWAATGVVMTNPMVGGSPMLAFFGGSAHYDSLVGRRPVGFHSRDIDYMGHPCHMVGFYSSATYGQVRILIGARTGLIHWCTYDLEPSRQRAQQSPKVQLANSMIHDVPPIVTELLHVLLPEQIQRASAQYGQVVSSIIDGAVGGLLTELHEVPDVNCAVLPQEFYIPHH